MRTILILLGVIISFTHIFAQSYSRKIDDAVMAELQSQRQVPVIVEFHSADIRRHVDPSWTKEQKAQSVYESISFSSKVQQGVQNLLQEKNIAYNTLSLVNGMATHLSYDDIVLLTQRPEVKYVYYDGMIKIEKPVDAKDAVTLRTAPVPEWGIVTIQADSVWKLGFEGEGVVVGGQDTGYDWSVSPLKKKYRGYTSDSEVDHNYNWHDAISAPDSSSTNHNNPCGYAALEPCDDHNHGTHTMGTMVGSDDNNLIGVAPKAKWIGCRNMDRGNGTVSTYLDCFEWFLAPTDLNGENPDPKMAPHVINNSWSCPTSEGCNISNFAILEKAVDNLRAAGIVVVVSAGNYGPNCHTVRTPAAIYESSFSVGATNQNDLIAGFSSRGTVTADSSMRLKPDVSAPGVGVRSVIRNGQYASYGGTSMAGPHVAGAVALIINANPKLAGQVETIETILEETAIPMPSDQNCGGIPGSQIPNPISGYGRIDALAAVERALAPSVSTENKERFNVSVYPIPAHDALEIYSESEIVSVSIYTISGKLVKKVTYQGDSITSVDIENLHAGMYIMQLADTEGRNHTQKIVKH